MHGDGSATYMCFLYLYARTAHSLGFMIPWCWKQLALMIETYHKDCFLWCKDDKQYHLNHSILPDCVFSLNVGSSLHVVHEEHMLEWLDHDLWNTSYMHVMAICCKWIFSRKQKIHSAPWFLNEKKSCKKVFGSVSFFSP